MAKWEETKKSSIPSTPDGIRIPLSLVGDVGAVTSLVAGLILIFSYNRQFGDIRISPNEDILLVL